MDSTIPIKVITPEEVARRRKIARIRQRRRRQQYVRIDYYPDEDVYDIIESVMTVHTPLNSRGSVINHIIREWSGARPRDRNFYSP